MINFILNIFSVLVNYLLSFVDALNLSKYILQFQRKGKEKLLSKLAPPPYLINSY